jgi:uncharacterized protein YqeY
MPTRDDFQNALKDAMRAGDETKKRTIRMVLAAIQLAEVEKRGPLDEAGVDVVLQREVKTRHESIQDAEKAGRPDLIDSTNAELALLQTYLPQQLSAEELESLVRQAISECGASGPQELGKVMKVLMPRVQGRADGKTASNLAKDLLSRA